MQLKKIRKQEKQFLVEGSKSILELLQSDFIINQIITTDLFYNSHKIIINKAGCEVVLTTENMISDCSSFASNNAGIAIANCKENNALLPDKENYTLILDNINDPGNLGTIIRNADWYGINTIIASENTSELYNPKVIAASMGSFCRVNLYYTDLPSYLSKYKNYLYAAILEGQNINETTFNKTASMLLMGNESHGISTELLPYVDERVFIPRYGKAESLNVGTATAIFLDHIKNI